MNDAPSGKVVKEIGPIRFAIDRYVLTFGAFLAVVLFGLIATLRLPVNLLPKVEFPVVAVVTTYPGGTPDDLDRRVSRPIEDAVASMPGVTDVQSTSSGSVSQVVVFFRSGTDVNSAANEVSQRVNAVRDSFPQGTRAPTVSKFDPNAQPIISLAVTRAGADLRDVSEWTRDHLKPKLDRVDGVADVTVNGTPEREIDVLLDEGKLQAYGLTPQRVAQALQTGAPDLPAGSVTTGGRETNVATRAAITTFAQVENTPVDSARGVLVGDVGSVRDSNGRRTSIARVNGVDAVLIEVRKTSGANTVNVARNVRAALKDVKLPQGTRVTVTGDDSTFIQASVADTSKEAVIVAIAVALVVLITLGKPNTAFAVVLAIPISLAAAPVLFSLLGFSFNILTLLALIVAMGIVVDDSIVVAENVDRYRRLGLEPVQAVLRGASEIFSAVSAATWSLLAVLLPISFIPGIIGQYFREFGLGLAAAIFFSWLEAIFFLTVRMAYTPDPEPVTWHSVARRARALRNAFGWALRAWRRPLGLVFLAALGVLLYRVHPAATALVLAYPLLLTALRYVTVLLVGVLGAVTVSLHAGSERVLDSARGGYVRTLRGALKRPWLVLAGSGVFFLSLFVVLPTMPFAFTPNSDNGRLQVRVDPPSGTSLQATDRTASRVEAYLRARPEVQLVQTSTNADASTISVHLVAKEERPGVDALVTQYRKDLTALLAARPEVQLNVAAENDDGGGSRSSDLELTLQASNRDDLVRQLPAILAAVRASEHVVSARTGNAATTIERAFVPDRAALLGTGLTPDDLAVTLRAYGEGMDAGTFRDGSESVPLKVKLRAQAAGDENALLALPAFAPTLGANLPLSSLGHFEFREAPASIDRFNKTYSVTLRMNLTRPNPGAQKVQQALQRDLEKQGLVGNGVDLSTGGAFSDASLTQELAIGGLTAVALAMLLNYLVLGAQFNSFRYPVYLMLPVPLAIVGAIWTLKLLGAGLDLFSILGMVILIGLVTKNAILLLDFVVERARSMPLRDALVESGGLRLRPIVMTTLTVLVISFPLIFGGGEGAEFRSGLGIVILGGIVSSTLLTLYVVPSAFYLFERRRLGKRDPQPEPAPDAFRDGTAHGSGGVEQYTPAGA